MLNRILFSLVIIALYASCSSSGKIKNDPNGKQLIFGNGGGFTGIYTQYELDENGDVFALMPDSTLKTIKKLKKKQTREIFDLAKKVKVSQPEFSHPGNMTSFVKYQVEGAITEYNWGDANIPVPQLILDLYNKLNTIIK